MANTNNHGSTNSFEIFSSASFKKSLELIDPSGSLKQKIKEEAKPKPLTKSEYQHIYQEMEATNPDEKIIWVGRSSQIIHFTAYFFCFLFGWLLIPLLIAWYLYERTKTTIYVLTQERLLVYSGIFIKRIDDLELYRVKDTAYIQPFLLRFFRLSNILLITSDASWGDSTIPGIEDGIAVREKIRKIVEAARVKKGVREVDYYTRNSSLPQRL